MEAHIKNEIKNLEGNRSLVPLLLLAETLPKAKSVEATRAAIEHQLEDREIRERVQDSAKELLSLCREAEATGLLRQGEKIDDHWLHHVKRGRFVPDPTQGVLSVITEQAELMERKLIIWKAFNTKPWLQDGGRKHVPGVSFRERPESIEWVRDELMKVSPSCYEARRHFNEWPFTPLAHCSGVEYAAQLGPGRELSMEEKSRINNQYRMESLSERILLKAKTPDEKAAAAASIAKWWRNRYERRISDEPHSQINSRLRDLLGRYGIEVLGLRPSSPAEAGPVANPLAIKVSVNGLPAMDRKLSFSEFEKAPKREASSTSPEGWRELPPTTHMNSTSVRSWTLREPELPAARTVSPTIEVGHSEIQSTFELLGELERYVKSFAGFAGVCALGREGEETRQLAQVSPAERSPDLVEDTQTGESEQAILGAATESNPEVLPLPPVEAIKPVEAYEKDGGDEQDNTPRVSNIRDNAPSQLRPNEVTSDELFSQGVAERTEVAEQSRPDKSAPLVSNVRGSNTPLQGNGYPLPGREIKIKGTDLVVRTPSPGRHVLRWEFQARDLDCILPERASVIEIAIDPAITSRESFERLSTRIRGEVLTHGAFVEKDPLGGALLRTLCLNGKIERLENFRFRPIGSRGTYRVLAFELADNAVITQVGSNEPGVVIQFRGTTACFDNVTLYGAILDIHIERAVWGKLHADAATVVSGSLGQSRFDPQSSFRWDGTRLNMREIMVAGPDIQRRLDGLKFSIDLFPKYLPEAIQTQKVSPVQWREQQYKANESLGKERLVQLVSSLTPGSLRTRLIQAPSKWGNAVGPARAGTTEGLVLGYSSRAHIANQEHSASTPVPSQIGFLFTAQDPRSEYPCRLERGVWIPSPGGLVDPTRMQRILTEKRDLWGTVSVHYHRALFEMLGYLTRPVSQGSERGAVKVFRDVNLENVRCVSRSRRP